MIDVVFVHLGDAPAKHLWANLKTIKRDFPNLNTHIIYNSLKHEKSILPTGAKPFFYKTLPEDDHLFQKMDHNQEFRRGFWRFSLERLIALEQWHKDNVSDAPIIHLESDIRVLPTFPFDKLSQLHNLAWTNFNGSHDVSAIFYSPNHLRTQWLANQIRKCIDAEQSITDMTALRRIALANPKTITYLPTLSQARGDFFEGVFDGASIGMWLTGRDPRNHFGFTKRLMALPESSDDASKYSYSFRYWSKDLIATNGNNKLRIYNLHVHSKNVALFSKYWKAALALDVMRTKKLLPATTFSISSLIYVIKDSVSRSGIRGTFRNLFKILNLNMRGD